MRRIFMVSMVLAAGATGPRAQDKPGGWLNPYHLDDSIVVTANRLATPERQIASSVTVITAAEIGRSQATSVTEVLRSVPGLNIVQSGGPGQQTAIFMRGTNSEHVQMLIDGVKINDPSSPSNAVNLATLSLDNIDRIEVLRGPQSVLYGSDAMGGVIQIFTRTGLGRPQVGLSLEGGSLNSHAERLSVRAGRQKHDYSVEISRRSTDGVSATSGDGDLEDDGFDNTTASAALGYRPSSRIQLRLVGRMADSDTDLDQGFGVLDDPNYTMNSKEQFASLRVDHDIAPERWRQQFGGYVTHYERSTVDGRDTGHPDDTSDTHYDGLRIKYDWQLAAVLSQSSRMTVGAETEADKLDQTLFYLPAWFGDPLSRLGVVESRTSSIYAMGELSLGAGTITAGGRQDHHDRFGGHGTYRLTGVYFADRLQLKLKGAYGSGFKAPSLYQIYDPATGNPNLMPERSWGGEVGVEKKFFQDRLALGATYFQTHFDNLIQYRTINPITFEGMMVNIAEARVNGVETMLGLNLGALHIRIDYTRTKAVDRGTDLDLLRRPRHKVSLQAGLEFAQTLSLGSVITHTGRREDVGGSTGRVTLIDYTVVNVFGSYALTSDLRLSVRISNLLDAEYEEVLAFKSLPRTISVGMSADF